MPILWKSDTFEVKYNFIVMGGQGVLQEPSVLWENRSVSESDMLLDIKHLKRGNKWHRLNIIKNKY